MILTIRELDTVTQQAVLTDAMPVLTTGTVIGTLTPDDADAEQKTVPAILVDDATQPGVLGLFVGGSYTWSVDVADAEQDGGVILAFDGATLPDEDPIPDDAPHNQGIADGTPVRWVVRFPLPWCFRVLVETATTETLKMYGTSERPIDQEIIAHGGIIDYVTQRMVPYHELPINGLRALMPFIAIGMQMRQMIVKMKLANTQEPIQLTANINDALSVKAA